MLTAEHLFLDDLKSHELSRVFANSVMTEIELPDLTGPAGELDLDKSYHRRSAGSGHDSGHNSLNTNRSVIITNYWIISIWRLFFIKRTFVDTYSGNAANANHKLGLLIIPFSTKNSL